MKLIAKLVIAGTLLTGLSFADDDRRGRYGRADRDNDHYRDTRYRTYDYDRYTYRDNAYRNYRYRNDAYRNYGYTNDRYRNLPPGIQKKLRRGGTLPPGQSRRLNRDRNNWRYYR